jgi:site-specific DNA-methyltransferase (adenine-specific)
VFGSLDVAPLTVGATCDLIWDEGKHGSGNLDIPWGTSHERIAFGVWSPFPSHKGDGASIVRRRRGSVLRYGTSNNGRGASMHPTRKPVQLLRELIEASSLFGEVVLDPFMGSGSTLEAARLECRRAVGIELEERYCEIAASRCAQDVLDVAKATA